MDILLECKNLSIAYNGKEAISNFNLVIPKGNIIAIVGESGSGKSTLLRSIIGLLMAGGKVTGGNIYFKGQDLSQLSSVELRKIRGKQIAMVFQNAEASLNPKQKIKFQFIESIRSHYEMTRQEAAELAVSMLEQVNLTDSLRIMNSYPFELSGGILQRINISMCMAMEPVLILADEPTSALDVTMQRHIIQELCSLKEKHETSIIIVTHNMGVASYMADQIAVIRHGKLVEWGDRDQVINYPVSEYTKQLLEAFPELEVDK